MLPPTMTLDSGSMPQPEFPHHPWWGACAAQPSCCFSLGGSSCLELGLWPVFHKTGHNPKWGHETSEEAAQRPKISHTNPFTSHAHGSIQCQALRSNS